MTIENIAKYITLHVGDRTTEFKSLKIFWYNET